MNKRKIRKNNSKLIEKSFIDVMSYLKGNYNEIWNSLISIPSVKNLGLKVHNYEKTKILRKLIKKDKKDIPDLNSKSIYEKKSHLIDSIIKMCKNSNLSQKNIMDIYGNIREIERLVRSEKIIEWFGWSNKFKPENDINIEHLIRNYIFKVRKLTYAFLNVKNKSAKSEYLKESIRKIKLIEKELSRIDNLTIKHIYERLKKKRYGDLGCENCEKSLNDIMNKYGYIFSRNWVCKMCKNKPKNNNLFDMEFKLQDEYERILEEIENNDLEYTRWVILFLFNDKSLDMLKECNFKNYEKDKQLIEYMGLDEREFEILDNNKMKNIKTDEIIDSEDYLNKVRKK